MIALLNRLILELLGALSKQQAHQNPDLTPSVSSFNGATHPLHRAGLDRAKNDLIRLFQVTYNKISALFGIGEVRPFLTRTVLGWLSRRTKACRFFGLFGLARY
jgi:hypothetical protein